MGLQNKLINIFAKTSGHYVNGRWEDEAIDDDAPVPYYGSAQPATPKEIEALPEGRKLKEVLKIFIRNSTIALSNSGQNASLVSVEGYNGMYEIVKIDKWDNSIISHCVLWLNKGGLHETV